MPVHCASAIASASSSLAGIPGFSRRPLSLAISLKRPLRYACQSLLSCTRTCSALIQPRFLLSYLGAIILHPLAPAHIASLVCSTTRQELVKRLLPSAAHLSPITIMILTHLMLVLVLASVKTVKREAFVDRRSQSTKWLVYWVADILHQTLAPGPLPSYVTGLAPTSPSHFPTPVFNGMDLAAPHCGAVTKCVFVSMSVLCSSKHSSILPP
jgi:hypothetical protein